MLQVYAVQSSLDTPTTCPRYDDTSVGCICQDYEWQFGRHCSPALLARNTMGAAISSGCPTRFMACIWAMWPKKSSSGVPFFLADCSRASVWMAAARNTHSSTYNDTGRVPFSAPDSHKGVHQPSTRWKRWDEP